MSKQPSVTARQVLNYLTNRKRVAELSTEDLFYVRDGLSGLADEEIRSRPCRTCKAVICLPDAEHPGICCACYDKRLQRARRRKERR